jgi:hypothetical protein
VIISKWRPYDFNILIFFAVNFFFWQSRCSRQFVPNLKDCLGYIWADRNNRQRLRIPGLGNISEPFFFEFSKVNVLKNLFDENIFNICFESKPHKNLSPSVFNICTSKPHRNLATPVWWQILFPVHKTWLSEYFL